jgi:hypothetical protein
MLIPEKHSRQKLYGDTPTSRGTGLLYTCVTKIRFEGNFYLHPLHSKLEDI